VAASQGIAPHLLRRSSGSTPHEAVTTNRQLQCPLPFSPAHRRQRPRSRPTARVVRALTANIVMQRSTEASTPACTVALSPKAIASNSALQSPQASPRGQIPIASAAPPPPTSRDFVPWRFSDAGRHSPWMISSSRRPRNLHRSRRSSSLCVSCNVGHVARRCRNGNRPTSDPKIRSGEAAGKKIERM
jgi:hypothetical protein